MRTCKKCGKEHLTEGFVFGDGDYYYCSEECLFEDMTEQEYIDLYEDGYAYWTEWEDEVISAVESAKIIIDFMFDCYQFHLREGATHERAVSNAVADAQRITNDPFSPNGKPLDLDAANIAISTFERIVRGYASAV